MKIGAFCEIAMHNKSSFSEIIKDRGQLMTKQGGFLVESAERAFRLDSLRADQ
jgi:hypothetical protein